MNGWVKMHRRIMEWEWYNDSQTLHLFIHLILSANHEDKNWMGITIKRGQVVTGRLSLSQTLGISEQSIRTSLKRLKSTSEITIEVTNKYSIITVCKYDCYQTNAGEVNQQNIDPSNQQSTNNQPQTRTKEDKNDIINEVCVAHKHDFETTIWSLNFDLPESEIQNFIDYWTDINKGDTKMRFEYEKRFYHKRRLITWKANMKPPKATATATATATKKSTKLDI